MRDAAWVTNEKLGDACIFEGDAAPFGQIGYTLAVLQPGEPSAMYHREEADQEDFLVLQGECIAIVEGAGAAAARRGTSCTARPGRRTSSSGRGRGRA